MRMSKIFIAASLVGIFHVGCSAETGPTDSVPGEESGVEEVDAKADGAKFPLGTYLADEETEYADDFRITTLTIKSDKTFYREDHGPACDPDGNCQDGVATYKGTVKFYKTTSGKKTIRFYDENGDRIDTI